MANKKTVVEMFEITKAMLNGETVEGVTLAEVQEFLNKRIENTQKKNANRGEAKPTKTQLENEGIKSVILSTLSTEPMTIGELMKANAELSGFSNQKVSALLTQLLKANAVVRTEVKGKAHYALPTEAEAE